ncbi:START domain-containing protein [Dyadobacter fanqingshengii]|uniref:START domain-containing protein n=1 Tax=Dyadobacter fanqingshengii TaxID=2906443 RepID=A0A9X1PBD9_9BACT|nr:START domain-containing protein [Dyadobacter fanqingshengii]MCF0041114.1 START domain-containing protein [Dyadobacter fanqingshengii]USJ37159.1 START domain-containing protein [Dyadobacter fanqingshengii]
MNVYFACMLRFLSLSVLFSLIIANAFAQRDWKLVTESEGIRVFSQSVPGSRINALRVECEVKASAGELVAMLLDVKAAEAWVFHTKSCDLLKKVSPSELYYYSEVSMPWPLSNRDFVAHIRVSQDKLTKIVTVDAPAVPGFVAHKEGIVRISHSKGIWIIKPLSKDKINIVYTLQVDPGGDIPAWVVNTFSAQGPLHSFRKMKQELQAGEYKNAAAEFIIN